MSTENRLQLDAGTYLGQGATFFVEKKEAVGKQLVAIKHIILDEGPPVDSSYSESTRYRLNDVLLEVQALLHTGIARHPNIIELVGYGWDTGGIPFLVTEYADSGDLHAFLSDSPITMDKKKKIAIEIAHGLDFMHECEIIHGDIKLENILVFSLSDNSFTAKLSDFGFCCMEALGNRAFRGTKVLNAPEIRQKQRFSNVADDDIDYTLSDVYAFGLAVWEILNDGRRFYDFEGIAIDSQDYARAESFLYKLDQDQMELVTYAYDFIARLRLPSTLEVTFHNVFEMTLPRDPKERAPVFDILDTLDPKDE